MSTPKVCKRCTTYLLDHHDPYLQRDGWKKCPSCGWCCDREGHNLVNKKEEKQDGKETEQEKRET